MSENEQKRGDAEGCEPVAWGVFAPINGKEILQWPVNDSPKDAASHVAMYGKTVRETLSIHPLYRRPSGWISVNDRLPDDNEDVLCVGYYSEVHPRGLTFMGQKQTSAGVITWVDTDARYADYDGTMATVDDVRYWQPLTQPPEP